MDIANSKDFRNHPCFNAEAKGKFGRIHLPVAPQCNIKCNFCDRKYDCVNESRPGVTSTLLSPQQALVYLERVLEKEPRITVAGIAGPGDPFANGPETMATLRAIRSRYPEMLLCVSSNGMAIAPYIEELAELELVAALGDLDGARLPRPVVDVLEQGPVDRLEVSKVEVALRRSLS